MPSPFDMFVTLMLFAHGGIAAQSSPAAEPATSMRSVKPAASRPLPRSVKIVRTPNAFASVSPSSKRYSVDCKIKADATFKDRSGKVVRSEPLEIPIPTITINDGESVTIQDTEQRSFEIARTGDGGIPITRDVWEGTKVEICVIGADDGRIVVDVNVAMQSANGIDENASRPAADAHSVKVNNLSGRLIQSVKVGEMAKATFEKGFAIEVVAKEVSQ
jgi:hypothetical protein